LNWSLDDINSLFAQLYQGVIPPAYAANGDGDIYYVHNDHLGTPVKMTNEMGLVIWQAIYNPFGKAAVDEDADGDGKAVEMNVRFPGQYYDEESGLHYNYYRTYDPEFGRYITSDPIGLFGGVNTFGYVYANPIRYIDSSGLMGSAGALKDLGENSNNKQEAYNNYMNNPTNENLQKWMDAESKTPEIAAEAVKKSAEAYYGRALKDVLKKLLPEPAKKVPDPKYPENKPSDNNGGC
jgi:RHS repeat-associated protein